MNITVLSIVGGLIILALATYAIYLLLKLKKQNQLIEQHQQHAIDKRNHNIFENVNTLCMVGIQGQCDLSEISIRVYCIMDYVQGEQRIDFDAEYPAISELYHAVKDMARGESRAELPKKERMQQNMQRMKAEHRLTDAIIEELKRLQQQVKSLGSHQIPIQMVH